MTSTSVPEQSPRAGSLPTLSGRIASLAAVVVLTGLLAACESGPAPADLVLTNGKVVTMDEALPEAEALAVSGDTVVAVGSADEIQGYVGSGTRVVDLEGALAVPGFIESHGHFMGLGSAQTQLDLLDAASWSEIVSKVDSAVAEARPGQWIRGRGWHQEKWDAEPARTVEGFPTRDELDRVAPENPVVLTHASGHAAIANGAALEAAEIGPDTESPPGGTILRDDGGAATGILVDEAEGLVFGALEESRAGRSAAEVEEDRRHQARLAAERALSRGVTSFQDMGASFETIDLLKRMASEGEMPIRLYLHVSQREVTPEQEEELAAARTVGHADDHVTVRAIGEVTMDGALGSRSAWMIEPYSDMPSSTGLEVTSVERVREIAEIGLRNGYQISTHAIGDRANRETLDLYQALFEEHDLDGDTLRWRVEHAQHLHPDDVARFGEMGVIASMQGIHACSDWPYVKARLGEERAEAGAYLWKSLTESGAVVTNGTDAPVERVDPIPAYHCTVAREMADSDSTFYPDEALSRMEALRTYTVNGAFAAFEEDRKGTLAPGMLADVAVLDTDVLTASEDAIPGTEVLYTVVGGEVVYQAGGEGTTGAGGG